MCASPAFTARPRPWPKTFVANWLLGKLLNRLTPEFFDRGVSGRAHTRRPSQRRRSRSAMGPLAEAVLLDCDGDLILAPVAAATEIRQGANAASEPRDDLVFTDAEPSFQAPHGQTTNPVLLAGAMARSAQIAGGLQRALDMVVEYCGQRSQFGRPIAKFQAVQQQVAVLAQQAGLARHAAMAAFARADNAPNAFASAMAKQVSSEAASEGAAIAHAVVGALGFTREYALQNITRRLWAWQAEFGSAGFWAKRIGEAACNEGPARCWPALVSGDFKIDSKTA